MSETLPSKYFDDVYAAKDDPWDFATSEYEAGKYRETLATLPRERYQNALEIGCSIGVQTAMLAERCDHLLGVDISERALEQARRRCAGFPNVRLERFAIPGEFPEGSFDLIVLSEVGYYFSLPDLERVAGRITGRATEDCHLLLVHFLPTVEDYPLTGDQVHGFFTKRTPWQSLTAVRRERYRIDLLGK